MRNIIILSLAMVILAGVCFAQTDSIPEPRFGHTMVMLNDTIFLFGGEGDSTAKSAPVFNDLWRFNEDNSMWEEETPIDGPPPARMAHSAVAHGGKMYVFFGEGESGLLEDIWKYDPSSNTWTECLSGGLDTPAARKYHSATSVGDKIYVGGGILSGDISAWDFWKYDPSTGDWESQSPHPGAYAGHGAFPFDGNIYAFGGYSESGIYRNDVWKYNPSTIEWYWVEAGGTLPFEWGYFASAFATGTHGVSIFTFGGEDASRAASLSSVGYSYKYDPACSTWTRLADGPAISHGAAACLSSGDSVDVYIFGGLNTADDPTNNMWKYDPDADTFEVIELGVKETHMQKPQSLSLNVYPNPFNSSISITAPADAEIEIYDLRGNVVGATRWVAQEKGDATHRPYIWTPSESISSGIYLIRATTKDGGTITKRIVYLK